MEEIEPSSLVSARLQLPDFDAWLVPDGPLALGPADAVLISTKHDSAQMPLIPRSDLRLAQNALLLRSAIGWLLFETGTHSTQTDGDAGLLPANLRALGIDPADIAAILPTHGHRDHIGGLVDALGRPVYPRASVHLPQIELDFWLADDRLSGPMQRSAQVARRNLLPVRERIVPHPDHGEVLSGVHPIAAPGHTIGHVGYLIETNGGSLFVAGDLAHHPSQLAEPAIGTRFDFDAGLAVKSRQRLFDWLADRETPCLFYHFDDRQPRCIVRRGSGFELI
jgi:glyoxylase-like metal-dependent hydrolase (beta-lactamase superfamily II)